MDLHVRTLLTDLTHRLDRHRGTDEEQARELKTQVQDALDREDHEGLAERLEEGAVRFEVAHPDLADTLRQVAYALGAGGI